METEFTREEAEWCISMLKNNLDVMERLPEDDYTEMRIKVWKKILIGSNLFTKEELEHINTKEEILKLNRSLIKELRRNF